MPKSKIILYFDLHSPFAYLAFHVFHTSPVFQVCDIEFVPVFLGGLITAIGAKPPWAIQNKARWIQTDRMRWAQEFKIPMAKEWPENYPAVTTLNIQRVLCALKVQCPAQYVDAIAALYVAFWADRRPIQMEAYYKPTLDGILGNDMSQTVMMKATTDEIKKTLHTNTERAISDGACGLPYIVTVNHDGQREGYWGFDHLGQVAAALGLGRVQSAHL